MDQEIREFLLRHLKAVQENDIASYTLLVSAAAPEGVRVVSHNESRVMIRQAGSCRVVHVQKSPTWQAPHVAPT